MKKQICILGSTGSIGTQALDVIEQHADKYEVYCLTANTRVELLAQQARKFNPAAVVVADESRYQQLQDLLTDLPDIKVYAGKQALCDIVQAQPIDMVLTAMVGFSGLEPTIHAIKAHKKICLANKETLVVAGELINELAMAHRAPILPVDSGGPFRLLPEDQLAKVTKADALRHPTWDMGAKITIDSATMMNKGFEVIEAKWLFGVEPEKIQVLVHPQSIIHSAVQFEDGSVKAQLGLPDMRLPIQYAFSYPDRLPLNGKRLDFFSQPLEFFEPDMRKFRCLQLAFDAIKRGGNMPCILNAANEVVNEAFRADRIGFLDMPRIIEETMQKVTFDAAPSLDTYLQTDAEARQKASELVAQLR